MIVDDLRRRLRCCRGSGGSPLIVPVIMLMLICKSIAEFFSPSATLRGMGLESRFFMPPLALWVYLLAKARDSDSSRTLAIVGLSINLLLIAWTRSTGAAP